MKCFLLLCVALAGCGGGNGATGDGCGSNDDCSSHLCLSGPWSGGYCSTDCSSAACSGADVCKVVQGATACLKPCATATDCRGGYMCFQGVCQPGCGGDPDCGPGFSCMGGQCTMLPGKGVGEKCATDGECSSRRCDLNSKTCQLACLSDGGCAAGQTCFVNPVDTKGNGDTDSIAPICIARRGTLGPGNACKKDGDCDRGSCQLGVCVPMCEAAGNCAGNGAAMGCVEMIAQVVNGAPKFKGCLIKSGTLTVDLGMNGSGPIGLPSTAVGMNIFVANGGQNLAYFTGVDELDDPMGRVLNRAAQTRADFLAQPIRYLYTEGTSMMLVSNDPSGVTLGGGLYQFTTFSQTQNGVGGAYRTQVRIKVGDARPTSGSIPLHVFVTNLSGSPCLVANAGNAAAKLGAFEASLKSIYAAAGLTVGPITYADSSAPSSFTSNSSTGVDTALDNELRTATANDTPGALELTIVKSIASNMQGFEILGISGGIPASTGIPGTVHSGVVASVSTYCSDKSGAGFATTVAHELGHSMGLWHSEEQDGTRDQITDNDADGKTNLMYWLEGSGNQTHLSAQQSMVLLANPAVN